MRKNTCVLWNLQNTEKCGLFTIKSLLHPMESSAPRKIADSHENLANLQITQKTRMSRKQTWDMLTHEIIDDLRLVEVLRALGEASGGQNRAQIGAAKIQKWAKNGKWPFLGVFSLAPLSSVPGPLSRVPIASSIALPTPRAGENCRGAKINSCALMLLFITAGPM